MGMHTIYPELEPFRGWLRDCGYTQKTVYLYSACVGKYLKDGNEVSRESAKALLKSKGRVDSQMAVYRYIDFLNGVKRKAKYRKGGRCNNDCFNCQYTDCIKG